MDARGQNPFKDLSNVSLVGLLNVLLSFPT